MGFLLPPLIVPDTEDMDVLQSSLRYMFIGTAAFTTLLFITVFFGAYKMWFCIQLFYLICFKVFDDKPKRPPSIAQAHFIQANTGTTSAYRESIKQLLTSAPSVFLIISYGE